jgi:hypothetical protein
MKSEAVAPEKKKEGEFEEYELKHKADVLMEAEEIKGNEKLMAALKPYLAK